MNNTAPHEQNATVMDTAWPPYALNQHNRLAPFTSYIIQDCIGEVCSTMPADAPIVEIGAGAGYLGSIAPDPYRAHFVQTEIGAENCRLIRQHNPDLPAICAKAQNLPFASETIGGVIARNVFDMVDTQAVINELGRVVHSGGVVAHLRDHRPNLVWVRQHLQVGNSKLLLPYFDQTGSFTRYQVVKRSTLKQIGLPNSIQLIEQITDPHAQEVLGGGSQDGDTVVSLRAICRLTAAHMERTTPSFAEIMDKKLDVWFRGAGFEPTFSNFFAEIDLPRPYADSNGWPPDKNCLQLEQDGYQTDYDDPNVPEDKVRIIQGIRIVTAIKQ